MDSLLFSVVIPTYNRAALLERALHSLAAQTLARDRFEVIVVDNNSTDDTRVTVARFSSAHYLVEPLQGLAHARNCGWRAARGRYVVYTDDDCLLPPSWLANAAVIVERVQPDLLGGPYLAYFDSPRPLWFKDAYGSYAGSDHARELGDDEYLPGGNFFVRRALLAAIGGFDSRLGVAGDERGTGEETALLKRIRACFPTTKVYYDPALFVYHLVAPRKLSLDTWARQSVVSGFYCYPSLMDALPPISHPRAAGLTFLRLIALAVETFLSSIVRDRRRFPYLQNYLCERGFRHLVAAGIVFARAATNIPAVDEASS